MCEQIHTVYIIQIVICMYTVQLRFYTHMENLYAYREVVVIYSTLNFCTSIKLYIIFSNLFDEYIFAYKRTNLYSRKYHFIT